MTNAELIKALRETDFGYVCEHCEHEDMCRNNDCVIIQAADALEAADEMIADCVAAIDALDDSNDAYIKENERLKNRIAELEAQLPKEGEWIKHGCEEEQFEYYECPLCGFIGLNYHYCPNCGAKMDGETEHGNTYSLGKIEMPNGAMKQIIADGERKDGEHERTD